MKPAALSTLLLSTIPLSAGCVAEEDDPGALEFRTTIVCNGCGGVSNSPSVNDFPLPEINLVGLFNADGIKVKGIRSPIDNTLHTLRVVDDELVAGTGGSHGTKFYPVATTSALIGWRIELEGPGHAIDHAHILGYTDLSSWAAGGAAMSAYAIAYRDADQPEHPFVNVCPEVDSPYETSVTVIAGETYDRELKTVHPGMTNWVTLACAAEAVFKMKRLAYGPNAKLGSTGVVATVAQRQATLKMLTADYCGTGDSYTNQGFPLLWKDKSGVDDTFAGTVMTEARWNENGATCLTRPRLVDLDDVACAPALPPCVDSAPLTDEWVTGVHP